MTAGKYTFEIEQRITFNPTITWTDSNNVPFNLTGYTAQMQIRPSRDSADVIYELSTTNGKIVIDAVNGKLTLTILPEDTAKFNFEVAVYDLIVTSSGGMVTRLLEGGVELNPAVTK